MADSTNWNVTSQLFGLETSDSTGETETTTTNWDVISGLFQLDSTTDQEEESETASVSVVQGQFVVYANDSEGYRFANPSSETVSITFIPDAAALWTIGTGNLETYPYVKVTEGMTGKYSTSNAVASSEIELAALVVKESEGSEYQKVGTEIVIECEPEQEIPFKCNDGSYDDNDGSVTVWWFYQE